MVTQYQRHKMPLGEGQRFVVVLLVLALALIIGRQLQTKEKTRLSQVLDGLLSLESSVNFSTDSRIAVGFGSCLDLLVDGIPLMKALNLTPPSHARYHEPMTSVQDFAETFVFFMSEGAAAERFISRSLLDILVAAARAHASARWAAGGNAPVISNTFARAGYYNIVVGAHASKTFKSYYHADLEFVEHLDGEDDIHLILEYAAGATWGNFTAPRANRFIVHSDENNPYLRSLESFREQLKLQPARLLIVSSLQMLDGYPFRSGERSDRMTLLRDVLSRQPDTTLIHFEMASFAEPAMLKDLLEFVVPYSDSLGMNEQELPNLVSMATHGQVITVSNANPKTSTILDDMRVLYKYLLQHSKRRLTRIHVHTLAFQAILTTRDSPWRNSKAASAKASLTAFRHVCGLKEVDTSKAKLIMDDSFAKYSSPNSERVVFDESDPVSCWFEEDYELCIAPVLVCTEVRQTVGGGDNITPAGLMQQI